MLLFAMLVACRGDLHTDTDGTSDDSDTDVAAQPVPFTALMLNCHSGGSEASGIAESTVQPIAGESLWGFEEVQDDADARKLVVAAADAGEEQTWKYVLGTTGSSDRLVLAWDDEKFDLLDSEELDDINVGGTARAPLVGHMKRRIDGLEFLFVVNHLWRSEDGYRAQQGTMLNSWGKSQTLPILMVGDYNFDWDVQDGENDHDVGYDNLTKDGVFVWVRPATLVKTECANSYDSVLDFDFVAGAAKQWNGVATILDTENVYCQEDPSRSDHRPVSATFEPPVQ